MLSLAQALSSTALKTNDATLLGLADLVHSLNDGIKGRTFEIMEILHSKALRKRNEFNMDDIRPVIEIDKLASLRAEIQELQNTLDTKLFCHVFESEQNSKNYSIRKALSDMLMSLQSSLVAFTIKIRTHRALDRLEN